MPTNLPPEYFEVEKLYRSATTAGEKAAYLEELISTIPKHKGTDKLRADLRRRLSKLKEAAQGPKAGGRQSSAFHIEREGAGQVAVVGAPNVGKSSLIVALTNASPEVAPYPFTTWTPTPGMMPVDNVQIQLIDTPPLNPDYVEPELFNLIRRVDLILLMVDLQAFPLEQLEHATGILEAQRIIPKHRAQDYEGQRRPTILPVLVVANKVDDDAAMEDYQALCELVEEDWPTVLPISVSSGYNLEALKWSVFRELQIMRVYARPPGKDPDMTSPFVLQQGATVEEFAAQVHKDFYENLKAARVWGREVFDGQLVGRDHVLHEGDVVELRI